MNGLPKAINLNPLNGVSVIQLSFGENELQLHFDSNDRAVVESGLILRGFGGEARKIDQYTEHATLLCDLLGLRVSGVIRTESGGLTLQFGADKELELLNENHSFESFQLHLRGNVIVA